MAKIYFKTCMSILAIISATRYILILNQFNTEQNNIFIQYETVNESNTNISMDYNNIPIQSNISLDYYFNITNTVPNFDEQFNNINFDLNMCIKNISKYNKYKSSFEYGIVWKFNDNPINKTAVLIMYIPSSVSSKFLNPNDPLSDVRYQFFKLENTLNYCYIHKYDLYFGNKKIYQHSYKKKKLKQYMNNPHFQKPFFIKHIFNNSLYKYNYQWVLYMDFDALFINCSKIFSVNHFLNIAHNNINKGTTYNINYDNISFIFAGDGATYLNSGVFIIKNNKWSNELLNNMSYLIINAHNYHWEHIKLKPIKEQKLFSALLSGMDINNNSKQYIQSKVNKMKIEKWNMRNYLYSIQDEYMRQYAIPIQWKLFNAAPATWFKSNIWQKRDMSVIHFYAEKAKKTWRFFPVVQHSMKHCVV